MAWNIYLFVIVWSLLECSVLPIPTELVMIPYIALTNHAMPSIILIGISGSAGSTLGASLDYFLGMKIFTSLDKRFGLKRKVENQTRRYSRFGKYALVLALVLGRVFPISLKPILLFAGATRFDLRAYLATIAASSFIRYALASTMISILGFF
jgi:membrane protein YqaA with SNARE-associated domain